MERIQYLGKFESAEELWQAFRWGGHEGDYAIVIIDGEEITVEWDKFKRRWKGTGGDGGTSTYEVRTIHGTLIVTRNLFVGGNVQVEGYIHAKGIRHSECGFFKTEAELKEFCPKPEPGQWAVVGDTIPGYIWRCSVPGVWESAGTLGGTGSLDIVTEIKKDLHGFICYTIDLTDLTDGSYFNIGERGFTPALIDALQKDAPKNFTLCVKQGDNTAQCPYGGFFLPQGQEGGNVYLISLNYQQPQFIRLLQGKSKIKVFIEDILRETDIKYASTKEIDELLSILN